MSSAPRPGPGRRQEVIDALCDAFARDALELEEFERRVESAHRAGTHAELNALLAGLPAAAPSPRSGTPSPAALGASQGAGAPARPTGPRRPRELIAGILGGSARRGRWEPARRITAAAIMGGVELDFREAALPPGVTEVHAFAFWGGVEILAPPGVRLESTGIGIMGGFDHGDRAGEPPPDDSAPVLRVTGVAVMGGVDIKVRYPGETGREARRRMREERRHRRLPGGDRG